MKIISTIIYITLIGQLCFFGGTILPRRDFSEEKFPFKPFSWESGGKVYELLNIRQWKSKLPDMSKVSKKLFPKKILPSSTAQVVDRLIKESCIAEMTHILLCILAFGIYNIWKNKVGVLLTVLYILVGNLPFVIIQRYNRPNFVSLRNKLLLKEEQKVNA